MGWSPGCGERQPSLCRRCGGCQGVLEEMGGRESWQKCLGKQEYNKIGYARERSCYRGRARRPCLEEAGTVECKCAAAGPGARGFMGTGASGFPRGRVPVMGGLS